MSKFDQDQQDLCSADRLEKLQALGFESEADYQKHQRLLQFMKDMAAKQKAASIAAGSTAFDHLEVSNDTNPEDMNPAWSNEHCEAAQREGWDIFDTHGSDGGPWQIQRFDDASEIPGAPQLKDDEAAWRIVAQGTAAHHEAARQFIRAHNPKEWTVLNGEPIKGLRLIVDVSYIDRVISEYELIGLLSHAVQKMMVGELACGRKIFAFSTDYRRVRSSLNDNPAIRADAAKVQRK